jgi:hypothetical protein
MYIEWWSIQDTLHIASGALTISASKGTFCYSAQTIARQCLSRWEPGYRHLAHDKARHGTAEEHDYLSDSVKAGSAYMPLVSRLDYPSSLDPDYPSTKHLCPTSTYDLFYIPNRLPVLLIFFLIPTPSLISLSQAALLAELFSSYMTISSHVPQETSGSSLQASMVMAIRDPVFTV